VQDVPEIRYARSGDVHIAYQTWGTGPNLVFSPPFAQNVETVWADPSGVFTHYLDRLGSFARVTHFDKRGTGLSDRVTGFHSIEERIDDIRAVMDAAGVERASLAGISEGGPMAMLFTAMHPERVDKLVLIGTAARFTRTEDYPYGSTIDQFDAFTGAVSDRWATPDSIVATFFAPTLAAQPGSERWITSYERSCASPGAVRDLWLFIREIDVRDVLSTIQAPTLVIHRTGDRVVDVDHGRFLAEKIANARYVELPGLDHVPWAGDVDMLLDHVQEFLTGEARRAPEVNRVLATVLFTDIVDSTRRASELGDAAWRRILDRHDDLLRRELARHGGTEVKTMGDGFLAVFDTPSRGVRAAQAMVSATADEGVSIRAGLHAGEIERRGDDIAGLAVHVAARVAAIAGAGDTLVSSTVRDLVLGSEFSFVERGPHALKGVDGEWRLFAVAPAGS
jgi:class 3 adenylate cyclase